MGGWHGKRSGRQQRPHNHIIDKCYLFAANSPTKKSATFATSDPLFLTPSIHSHGCLCRTDDGLGE